VGALDFTAELSATRQSVTHDSSELKQHDFRIPHAHTVGGGRSGLRFKLASLFLALLILGGIALAPRTALNTAMIMFTGLILTQAFLRLVALALPQSKFDFQPIKTPFARLGPHDWPSYTVLVPLKDEAHMVTGLMATLSKLDYPQERLQIIFITEEDDPKTRRAVTAALRPPFSQVVVWGRVRNPMPLTLLWTRRAARLSLYMTPKTRPTPRSLKQPFALLRHTHSGGRCKRR